MDLEPVGGALPAVQSQAILTPITEAAIFLLLTVDNGGEEAVRDLLADVSGLTRSVGFRVPDGGLVCVVGLGSELWGRLFGAARPVGLHRFAEIVGPRHTAVSTAADLLFHIRAHRLDLCFELAQRLGDRLLGHARVVDEVHGFKSFDERDLLGFVDGSESPSGAPAVAAAIVGEEDPDFAGGSYVVVQKYLHDLSGWDKLTVEEQERAIGRSKLDNIEMPDDVKPSDSHVALNTIVDDEGNERQIVRYNMPFGRVGADEFGTYFIGYARDPGVIEQMLRNMFLGKPEGNSDRILDFSTPKTGALFFVPTADFLDDPPSAPTAGGGEAGTAGAVAPDAPGAPSVPASTGTDGSLGIGSLAARPATAPVRSPASP